MGVAVFVLVASCAMIVVLALMPDLSGMPKRELLDALGFVVPASLGFLFGRSAGSG